MEKKLPKNWVNCNIDNLPISLQKGVNVKEKGIEGEVYYIPSGSNFFSGVKLEKTKKISGVTFNNVREISVLRKGDLLFNSGGVGTLGRVGYFEGLDLPAVADSFILIIRTINNLISSKYLFYWFQSFEAKQLIKVNTRGTTGITSIKPKNIGLFIVPIAPLREQKRIVAKLDRMFESLDNVKFRLDKVPKLLKDFRQAVLTKAISGKLTQKYREETSLSQWNKTSLGSISTLVTSGSRGWAKYYSEEGAIFVRAQNINKDYLDLNDIAFVKLEGSTEGIRTRIFENDLLITITGGNVTKTALVDFPISEAYVSQHVSLVRLKSPEFSKFVYLHLICESEGRRQLNDFAYGQGKPQLNLTNIKHVEIEMPSIIEQAEIVKRVEILFSKAKEIEEKYKTLKQKIDNLPQTILAKAFKGELLEQLPTDGDARELLEDIQRLKMELKKK